MNRQPLNVELLTLDDGTQKIAWDIKQLQSLLGISDLLHQEELSSAKNTGVNSSGIPTIETVIAILDELGLKDLYEVRYRKQYATIIPKTDSKRPKVAMYVVQQQSDLVLSIHEKIWSGHQVRLFWYEWDSHEYDREPTYTSRDLYIPESEKPDFIGRMTEVMENQDIRISILEENLYSTESSFAFEMRFEFEGIPLLKDMCEQSICYKLTKDQRFPSTDRISIVDMSHLTSFLSELKLNIELFLRSNGEKPENTFKQFDIERPQPKANKDFEF
ncbi:hypothetical protein HCU40_02945 [Pseudanabaena biceps]|nr:hypothetical protein [Pseudanabaena biceps]